MWLSKSVRWMLLAGGVALLACGCNKTGESKDPARQAKGQPVASAPEGAKQPDELLVPPVAEYSQEQVSAMVRNQAFTLAAAHGVAIDPSGDLVKSLENPNNSEPFSEMIDRVANLILNSNEPVTEALVGDYTGRALDALAGSATAAGAATNGTGAGGAVPPPLAEENLDKYKDLPVDAAPKLKVPSKIIGVWNSVAEIKDSTIVNHDTAYFDAIDFRDRADGSYTSYRDGAVSTHLQFTYTFDPDSGRLLMRFEDATVWTVVLQQPVDNPAELRLTRLSEGQTTVFRLN